MFENDINITFILAQIFIFASVILIFYSARDLIIARMYTSRRLQDKSKKSSAIENTQQGLALDNTKLKRYDKYLTPDDQEKLSRLRRALIRGGYRKPSDVRVFNAVRIVSSFSALFLGVVIFPMAMQNSPIYLIITVMLLTLVTGFFGPKFWLDRNFQYRKLGAQEGFPDALDLILVCIEAGHGFDQALNRVVKEIKISSPILAEELQIVVRELSVGKNRYDALGDFAWRTGVDDISSFITVIKQADKFGVSIADALRVYSSEMRDKRYMRAEEKANMMPVKLALGAIMFTVPPAIIAIVGPSIIMIIRHLAGAGS